MNILIANTGDEQSINIQRRSVDTRHAQELARRAIGENGQRWIEPGSTARESGSPRRRPDDSDNYSRVSSDDGSSPRPNHQSEPRASDNGSPAGRGAGTDDAQGLDPAQAKQTVQAMVDAYVDQQMTDFFAQHGACRGAESSTCQDHSCLLTSSGCEPFTPKEQQEITAQSKQILFTIVSTGKCTPSRDTAQFCSKAGYCDFFDMLGVTDDAGNPACDKLNKEEYAHLISSVHIQPDGSLDVADDGADESDKRGASPDEPYEREPKRVQRTFGKRSTITVPGADDKSADDKTDFLGIRMTQQQLQERAISDAKRAFDTQYTTLGTCEEGFTTCHKPCQLGTPGCKQLSDDDKADIINLLGSVLTEVYTSGKCDRPNTGNCDVEGHCHLWLAGGARDHNCKSPTLDELQSRIQEKEEKLRAIGGSDAGGLNRRALHKVKRDVSAPAASSDDDNKVTFFGGVRVDQLGLAQHILEYTKDTLESVADLNGHRKVCDGAKPDAKQSEPAGCRDETCTVSKDKGCEPPSQTERAALEAKLRIAYTRLFYSGSCDPAVSQKDGNCDASGWCQLWLGDDIRDHSCKELTSEQSQERLRAILHDLGDAKDTEPKEKAQPGSADDTITFEGKQLTQMQLAQQVVNWAVEVMSHDTLYIAGRVGRCDAASNTCVDHRCSFGTKGCRAFTEEEAAALVAKYEILYTRVMFSGACEPKRSQKDGNCDRFGRCRLWLSDGKRDQSCDVLNKLQYNQTLDETAAELGGWGTLLPPLAETGQDSGSGNGKHKREVNLDEQALSDDDNMAKFNGELFTETDIQHIADSFAAEAMQQAKGTDKIKARTQEFLSETLFNIFASGNCDAATRYPGNCNKNGVKCDTTSEFFNNCNIEGRCMLWINHKRDHACHTLTREEMRDRLTVEIEAFVGPDSADLSESEDQGASSGKTAAKHEKRSVDLLKRALPDATVASVYAKIKRDADDNTADYSAGPVSERQILQGIDNIVDEWLDQSAGLNGDRKEQLGRVVKEALLSVVLSGKCVVSERGSSGNCDATGRCMLWVNHVRDHACQTLSDAELDPRFKAAIAAVERSCRLIKSHLVARTTGTRSRPSATCSSGSCRKSPSVASCSSVSIRSLVTNADLATLVKSRRTTSLSLLRR